MKTAWGMLLAVSALGQSVLTANYDAGRSNATANEFRLAPSNVTSLIKLGQYSVDAAVFAQPLYIPNVTISGVSRNLLIVVTMNDSIYAFDADRPGTAVWSNVAFDTPYSGYPDSFGQLYGGPLGCLSTPVVDVPNSLIYAVCDGNTPNWVLRAFSLTTGSVVRSATVTGQVIGTGDTGSTMPPDNTSGPNLIFFPKYEFQRQGLALSGGDIYIGFGGLTDTRPWHGWEFAYKASDFSQQGVFCTTPNGFGGGIWMAGGGPVIDGSGNLYVATGNGTNQNALTSAYTESVLKLSPTLSLLGSWTPSNNVSLDANDEDLAAGRVVLIPGTNLLTAIAGKDYNVYVLDALCLTGGSGTTCQNQTFKTNSVATPGNGSGSYGAVFLNNALYLPTTLGDFYAFAWTGSSFNTTATTAGTSYAGPNAQMAASCSGTSRCVLWVVTSATSLFNSSHPGTLRALDPATLSELWNDGGAMGEASKFASPLVANGTVFVPSVGGSVTAFGLPPATSLSGGASIAGGATIQ